MVFSIFEEDCNTMRMNIILYPFFLLLLFGFYSCESESVQPLPSSVQEVLATLKSKATPGNSYKYFSDLYVEQLEKKLAKKSNRTPQLRLRYAEALLNSGSTDKAIMELHKLKASLSDDVDPGFIYQLNKQLAVSYLRMGEEQNCFDNAAATSCVFPLDEEAVYMDKIGPRFAIDLLEELLDEKGEDLETKWLLNLAYMTVGNYPDSVPSQFLISPDLFTSSKSIGRFRNVASSSGLATTGLSGGVIMDDFNNDGALDIVVSALLWEGQLRYYENNGDGSFTDRTESAGLLGEFGGLNLIQADYNNDGWLDFFVLRGAWFSENGHHPNSLLRNNGDGTFTDVTIEAGLYSLYPTQAGVWGDFNRDGWIDLMIVNESNKELKRPIEFYQNNKDGTFRDVAKHIGVDFYSFYKGVVVTDFNNDLWPDVFISNIRGDNILLQNEGIKENGIVQFTNVSERAGIQGTKKNFPCWSWDVDNDGLEDLMAITYSYDHTHMYEDLLGLPLTGGESPGVFRNNGDGTFTDDAEKTRLNRPLYAMAGNFGDFDNDGYLDFFLGTGAPSMATLVPNRMFRNEKGSFFEDITYLAEVGHIQKGHAIAVGDLDNDGDQDLYVMLGGIYASDVFENAVLINPGQGNNWVNLKLIGTEANRAAIGSKITLTIVENEEERKLFHTVNSGGSFGASSLQQEIGLGKANQVKSIRITWAGSGTVEVFEDVAINQAYQIIEGQGKIEGWSLQQIEL